MVSQFSVEMRSKTVVHNLYFTKSNDVENINSEQIPEFKEQNELEILLRSDHMNTKLYIPDLDDYQLEQQLIDSTGGRFYIANNTITLYKHKIQDIPLIPGYYLIKVEIQEVTYYSWFKIVPKDLSIEEWKVMKNEIDTMAKGLIMDYKQRNTKDNFGKNISYEKSMDLNKITDLVNDIPKIILALKSLEKNAKFNIYKKYAWKPIGDKNQIDHVTIRKRARHPEKLDFVYSHTKKLNYDIDENRWIKYILMHFIKFSLEALIYVNSIIQSLENNFENERQYLSIKSEKEREYLKADYRNKKIRMKSIYIKIKQFHAFIYSYNNKGWMIEVNDNKPNRVPKTLVVNAQYNNIYKVYLKSIKDNIENIQMDKQFQYFWKRTDYLYEVWAYIKTIKLLQDLGYNAVEGWIFDDKLMNYIPFLDDGTRVTLVKGDQKLVIVFNETLQSRAAKNTLLNPLSTFSNRNKPDIRIDIFNLQNDYMGGVIIEAKYKPLANIFDTRGDRLQQEQLQSYKNDTFSTIINLDDDHKDNTRAVESIFTLYPRNYNNYNEPKFFSRNNIFFNELRPEFGEVQYILSVIDKINTRYAFYNKFKSD